jgi:hypothetical protein
VSPEVPVTRDRLIGGVAVVVPARDEEEDIEACLAGVRAALARLPSGVVSAVSVVLDRCADRTPQRVAGIVQDWPEAGVLRVGAVGGRRAGGARRAGAALTHIVTGSGVGAVRDLGVRDALIRLRSLPPSSVWVLSTDADTAVEPDWVQRHLRLAETGVAGVAGTVELRAPLRLSARALLRYENLVLGGIDGDHHDHVYGANLGVRGDAYLAVGGFAPDGPGEDHALWRALRRAGYRCAQPTALCVRTSARTHGRATGGLADLLREFDEPSGTALGDAPPAG